MTTITFEETLNIEKFNFRNVFDFTQYINEKFFIQDYDGFIYSKNLLNKMHHENIKAKKNNKLKPLESLL